MRKHASPWLVSLMALMISGGISGAKAVHADELVSDTETVVSEDTEDADYSDDEMTDISDSDNYSDTLSETDDLVDEVSTDTEEKSSEEFTSEENESEENESEENVSEDNDSEEVESDAENSETVDVEETISDTDNEEKVISDIADSQDVKEEISDVAEQDKKSDINDSEIINPKDAETVEKLSDDSKPVVTNDEDKNAGSNNIGWTLVDGKYRFYYGSGAWDYYISDSVYLNGNMYYFDSDGYMVTGWKVIDGDTYYFLDSGRAAQGWKKIDGNYYFFGYDSVDGEGNHSVGGYEMRRGGVYPINDTAYFFDDNGIMKTGWFKSQYNDWYHADNSGKLDSGWKNIDNIDYFFGYTYAGENNTYILEDFYMNTYQHSIYGDDYYFSPSGALMRGWINVLGDGSVYYHSDKDGKLETGWKKIDNNWYHFGYEYKDENGKWVPSGYEMNKGDVYTIAEKSYMFNKSGQMLTGWINNGEYTYWDGMKVIDWYYADTSGVLQSGWTKVGDKTYFFGYVNNYYDGTYDVSGFPINYGSLLIGKYNYYFGKDGALKEKGWIETKLYDAKTLNHSSSMWYYAKKDGILAQGWCQIDGKWYFFGNQSSDSSREYIWGYDLKTDNILTYKGKDYYLDKDGVLQTGFYYRRNIEYFMPCYSEPDGSIVSGWKTIDGKKYYVFEDGSIVTGFHIFDGYNYFFGDKGDMKTGWVKFSSPGEDKWGYFEKDGKGANGWKTIGGKTYYFSNGITYQGINLVDSKYYYFDENGALVTGKAGWYTYNDPRYSYDCFVYNDGTVKTEFMTAGDVTYGIRSDGYLIKNGTGIDYKTGKIYLFDENGRMVKKNKAGWVSGKSEEYDENGQPYFELVWYYMFEDNTVAIKQFLEINGATYGFNIMGHMMTNTTVNDLYNPKTHTSRDAIFGSDGKEITKEGWNHLGADWYYVEDGKIIEYDKRTINGSDYIFDEYGRMISDDIFMFYDGMCYIADKNGKVKLAPKGWHQLKMSPYYPAKIWYYFDHDGIYTGSTGLVTIGKGTYYINPKGNVSTGVRAVGSYGYVFGPNGNLSSGWTKATDGSWLYANDDGTAYNGILNQNGKQYIISDGELVYAGYDAYNKLLVSNSDGSVRTEPGFFERTVYYYDYYFGDKRVDTVISYVDEKGHGMEAGWHVIDGDTYYFRNGNVLTGEQSINYEKFVFDDKGRLISNK